MKEYDYKQYRKDIIERAVQKYGSLESAVFEMDAYVSSLKIENDTLKDMINPRKSGEVIKRAGKYYSSAIKNIIKKRKSNKSQELRKD